MVKITFHHRAGNDDKLVKALYGVFCYHMVDAYTIFSKDCRDISESARLFLHKDAEEEAALCLLDGLHRDLFICDTAVPAAVIVEKISQDGDGISHNGAGRRQKSCQRQGWTCRSRKVLS